jgi:hypothetical protein
VSVLDGVLEVGDLVWQQMYSPTQPAWDATLAQRIEGGALYGERRLMVLVSVRPCDGCSTDLADRNNPTPLPPHSAHWLLAQPGRENDRDHYSIVDDNWCVLEHAESDGLW